MAEEIEETEGSMIERMMRGEFDDIEISEEVPAETDSSEDTAQEAVSEDEEASLADESNEDEDNEDTENSEEEDESEEEDPETNEQNDDEAQDNGEATEDETEEEDSVNAPVESDSESKAETKDQSDGDDSDNDEPNYKEEYEKLLEESKTYKDYYDTVTSEFTANGVKVKGFTDPQKVIQAQQAMYGLEDKFSKLKKYRQFHAPLEKRGMIKDQSKFDLAMNIMDGDQEAIKAHLKSLDIDPISMDLDEVNYSGRATTSSEIELGLNDMLDASATAGIKSDVERVIYDEWDQDSVVDLLSTEGSRSMFVDHMKPDGEGNSIFKAVSQKAKEMSMLNSGFSDLNSIQKYNAALSEMEKEYSQSQQQSNTSGSVNQGEPANASVNDTIAEAKAADAKRLADAEAEAVSKYKLELEKKNAEADKARKRAASVSTKKTVKKNVKKEADPMKLEGDSFMDYWKQLERAGLK